MLAPARFRSKTFAALLAFLLGSVGAHRFYLFGRRDRYAWLHIAATLLGAVGVGLLFETHRASLTGWVLATIGAISVFAAFIAALRIGLRPDAQWDQRFNAATGRESRSGWPVVFIVIFSLFIGASLLMAALAITFQTYFEFDLGQTSTEAPAR
ncbi:NINE protein [Chitinasiproducens palmae]|uniref:TM2 domain-containing protein n=1 Tax=Chitinasiproducens palmae TaxID=1770053 RepID=A0A1H2PUL4_9BURK|nr:TM2 domain-containing protein [Chitinasiproducens palmae]SDV50896.1 TM2 domain-containing protein [Chitinasiproducens palmae]